MNQKYLRAIVGNLRDEVFEEHDDHRFLYCGICGAEDSAHQGDYWNLPRDYEFMCCNRPMVIATKETTFRIVPLQSD